MPRKGFAVIVDVRPYIAEAILLHRTLPGDTYLTKHRDEFVSGFVDEVLYLRNIRNVPLQEAVLADKANREYSNVTWAAPHFIQQYMELAKGFINCIETVLLNVRLNVNSAYTYRTLVNNSTLILEVHQ